MAHSSLIDEVRRERLKELLGRVRNVSIGVVGDLALDIYWYADMTRSFLSRETPHFPRPVVRESYSPGAGANIADNLRAQGVGYVSTCSVLGDDWRGQVLRGELSRRDIDVSDLFFSRERITTAYIKPILMGYESEQEDARLDFENVDPLTTVTEDFLIEKISDRLADLKALIVVDQLEINGIVTRRVRQALNQLAETHSETIFLVDSRQRIGLFQDMVLKPNRMEALAVSNDSQQRGDVEHLNEIGRHLSLHSGRPTFITLGDEGVLVCTSSGQWHIPAAPVQPPLDPVGAGDTFIATLATTLSTGATAREAAAIANLAAAVVLEKLNQTGTASPAEILARYDLASESHL